MLKNFLNNLKSSKSASSEDIHFFNENGYLILKSGVDTRLIDRLNNSLKKVWIDFDLPSDLPNRNVQLDWIKNNKFRLQDGWHHYSEIKRIALSDTILITLRDIYNLEPKAFQTLNFFMGTEQEIHADSVHFNSVPKGLMCGVWVALEDISMEQGPLTFYPKTHKLDEVTKENLGFTPNLENYYKITKFWNTLTESNEFEEKHALLKKGEAIIWHANLLHGGKMHTNRTKTRQSQVTHYYFDGAKPWRPLYTQGSDKYFFEPEWIL